MARDTATDSRATSDRRATPREGAKERRGPRHGHVLGAAPNAFHKIAYTEWGAPDAPRVAICVHGLSRQGRDFDPLAIKLAANGYRVICPDLVGRGRSDWLTVADADEYGLPQYCADMTVLLAGIGAQKVEWVGTSLGGLIGIMMAGQPQSPVVRLVVNDIGPFVPWSALYRIGAYLRQSPWDFAGLTQAELHFRKTLAPFGDLGDAEWRHLTIHSVKRLPGGRYRMLCDPGIAQAFRPSLYYNLSLWRYWDAITCPTLLLRGEHSDLLLRETADEMARRGPRPLLVEIFDCGHAPALLNREQVDLVATWLID